uniref:Peptidase A1 domain-containing protein n=1 Tax=Oryza nivara TaxID=4536 RepID=A0A0E0I1L2_ORYNI
MAATAAAILALVLLLPPTTLATDVHGFRATLTRIHQLSPGKYSAAVRRDSHRLAFLSHAAAAAGSKATTTTTNSSVSFQTLLDNSAGAYNMDLSIGTPPVTFSVLADTGSSLIWTQCAPCTKCAARPAPPFQPASSSTFSKLPCASSLCQFLTSPYRTCNATGCVYYYPYGMGFTAGYLATETLHVGGASFPGVAFGCSTENGVGNSSSGIVGLGRSPLSLVSQVGVGRFSYCLRSDMAAGDSPILFGSLANITGGNVQSTPLLENPEMPSSSYYYVNLTGITVGATDLPVTSTTFGFTRGAGAGLGGGTIVDSGTTLTYLVKEGYAMVKRAFLSQMAMANLTTVNGTRFGFDLCFDATGGGGGGVPVPKLVLRFAGGAEYAVRRRSYFGVVAMDSQGRAAVECLLVLPASEKLSISIIGNVMQMDLHVLYDLDGGMTDIGNMASTAAILALILLLLTPITLAGDLHGFRGTLTRIHQLSPGKYSEAVRRDSHRIAFLSRAAAYGKATTNSLVSFQALLERWGGGYNMNLSIGTPPLIFPVVADTGSDLIWTQCAPCTKCFTSAPVLQPASSSTFSKLPCTNSFCKSLPSSTRTCNATGCVYDYPYGKGYTAGYLATETVKVGDASFPNVALGCSTENGVGNSSSGIAGLGRGNLSLVSQLGVRWFSYCLRSDDADAAESPILFGSLAKLTDGNVQSTPLLKNPEMPNSSYYYVNLTGIAVGSTDLPVTGSTFGFTQNGLGGGTIVDSGTTFTYLVKEGYAMVKQAFLSQMANLTTVNATNSGFDLCFEASASGDQPVPTLVLRFAGGGGELSTSYFDVVAVDSQGRVAVECLLVLPAPGKLSISIIGNFMQMDMHVLYDLDGEMFSFAPADCAKL